MVDLVNFNLFASLIATDNCYAYYTHLHSLSFRVKKETDMSQNKVPKGYEFLTSLVSKNLIIIILL